jgi:hypothetical protein
MAHRATASARIVLLLLAHPACLHLELGPPRRQRRACRHARRRSKVEGRDVDEMGAGRARSWPRPKRSPPSPNITYATAEGNRPRPAPHCRLAAPHLYVRPGRPFGRHTEDGARRRVPLSSGWGSRRRRRESLGRQDRLHYRTPRMGALTMSCPLRRMPMPTFPPVAADGTSERCMAKHGWSSAQRTPVPQTVARTARPRYY